MALMHDMLMRPDGASSKVRRRRAAAVLGWLKNRRAERVGLRSSPRRQEAMFNWISVCIRGWYNNSLCQAVRLLSCGSEFEGQATISEARRKDPSGWEFDGGCFTKYQARLDN